MLFTQQAWAQHILFLLPSKGQLIQVKEGDILSIRYKGYLGQTETYKNTLTYIGDSSFILGTPGTGNNRWPGMQQDIASYKEIKYRDILAFRKIGIGRSLLKSSLTMGGAIGSIVVLGRLYSQSPISDFGKIGISLGVGLGINYLINAILPENPKHKIEEGWQIKSIKE